MPTRVLSLVVAAILGLGLLPTAAAAAEVRPSATTLCCKVVYRDGYAIVKGYFRIPAGARLLHVGMNPPVGACTSRVDGRLVFAKKRLKRSETVKGYYRFVYVFMDDGEMVTRQTPRVWVRGKLSG
jgi:hypothetical protein